MMERGTTSVQYDKCNTLYFNLAYRLLQAEG